MSWATPRTWSPGELVTATLMNEQLRDNLNAIAPGQITIGIGAAGNGTITTGEKTRVPIEKPLRITGWTVVGDASGSIVVDIWRGTFASPATTNASSIAGTEKPTLSAVQRARDLTLTTWDDEIDAGDELVFVVDSAATVQQVTVTLRTEPR